MRCVVQRSGPASVLIGGETVGRIERGLVVLAAFGPTDTSFELAWMARKLPRLRIFNDPEGKMNLSLQEVGGGILLALNVVMLQVLPGTWGARFSFLSVAIWWAVFSRPVLRRVPEPPSATEKLSPGESVVAVSFKRLWQTF